MQLVYKIARIALTVGIIGYDPQGVIYQCHNILNV